MAPGANYMGGKRNAARARSKDATGRAHKNFFSRQRLDILSKGLSGGAPSGGSTSGLGPRITASDIDLSHAKHLAPGSSFDREDLVSRRVDTESTPSRPTHLTEETRSRMRSSSDSRSSKILEALDTTEPLAMRAAMNRILSFPDLAGLSARPRSPPRMKRSCPEPSPSKSQPKRQKTRVSPSPPLSDDQSLEDPRHESMDVDDPVADASDEHYSETETDGEEEDFGLDVHSYSIHRPATPLSTANKENAPSPPVPRAEKTSLIPPPLNYPPISLASRPVDLTLNAFPPPGAAAIPDNLYDYQDPWNAIGFILGLEEDNQSGRTAKGRLPEDLDFPEHSVDRTSQDSSTSFSFDSSYASPEDEVALLSDVGVDSVKLALQFEPDTPNEHTAELDRNSTDGHEISHASSPECVELEPLVHYHSDETTTDDGLLSPPSDAPSAVPEIPSKFLSPVLRPIESSPHNSDLRDGPRFPKFAKFPCTPNPVLARLSQNSSRYSPPRAPSQVHRPLMTHSPLSLERILPQEPRRPRDAEQRIFKIARIGSPEVRKNIVHSETALQPEVRPPSNGDGNEGPDVREKFFGDFCLFSDEVDALESDG
ncbi:hypothetical protein B0H16DRAFT_1557082 [Mycena metata]|uniref:Uncharacterized protein n=1 Tax=Mycena metata TaxID=1033252 RepID=A0AAD7IPY6_9AGAR|nr:hypothetical protein B0H16DRAFT_1557082 [Mycena metata]